METSLTSILKDTINCTSSLSSFLLPVIRVLSDHQLVTECLLKNKVAKCICLWFSPIKFLFGNN